MKRSRKFRRIVSLLTTSALLLSIIATGTTSGEEQGDLFRDLTEDTESSENSGDRQTWSLNMTLAPGQTYTVAAMQMHIGDTVTFNFTYTPVNAEIWLGVVEPDGTAFGWTRTNGSSATTPNYTLTLRREGMQRVRLINRSASAITISGTYTLRDNRRKILFWRDPTFVNDTVDIWSTTVAHMQRPFAAQWNISFEAGVLNLANNNSILSRCRDSNDPALLCTCTTNANCRNETTTDLHHTNALKNMAHLRGIPAMNVAGWNLYTVLVSSRLCGIWANHREVGGVGDLGGRWSYNNHSSHITAIARVRILQHEISHNFGAGCSSDRPCTTGEPCIMNEGFWFTALDDPQTNIWCTLCRSEFNPNLHLRP